MEGLHCQVFRGIHARRKLQLRRQLFAFFFVLFNFLVRRNERALTHNNSLESICPCACTTLIVLPCAGAVRGPVRRAVQRVGRADDQRGGGE